MFKFLKQLISSTPDALPAEIVATADERQVQVQEKLPLKLGDRVVLLPQGWLGRVESVEVDVEKPSFVFDNISKHLKIPFASKKRYRPLLSAAEAEVVELELCQAPPVPDLLYTPHQPSHLRSPEERAANESLEKHLESKQREHQVAGYATLLDWAASAQDYGEEFGFWRGQLSWSRDFLLGELAIVFGMPHDAYEKRLIERRRSGERVATGTVGTIPSEEKPQWMLDWYPGIGSHSIGELEVGQLLVCSGGVDDEGDQLGDTVELSSMPGTWRVHYHVGIEEIPEALVSALVQASTDEKVVSVAVRELESALMSNWLVLTHVGHGPFEGHSPTYPLGRALSREEHRETAIALVDGDKEARESVLSGPVCVAGSNGLVHTLQHVGTCWTEVATNCILTTRELTAPQAGAFRYSRDGQLNVWPWGLQFFTGGDGGTPVFALSSGGLVNCLVLAV